jgi:hypothetical protein
MTQPTQRIGTCEDCPDQAHFWCVRHGVNKTATLRAMCRSHPEFWRAWEDKRGPGQAARQTADHARTPQVWSEKMLTSLEKSLAPLEARRAVEPRIPAARPIDEIRRIVQIHCLECSMFCAYGCMALPSCDKVAEYRALLTSPRGRCPQGVW